MAVGFPVKDDYATGDVLTAANMNDFAGTLNTVPDTIGAYAAGKNKIINGDFRINQRAFTSSTTATFGFDRWSCVIAGDGTATYSAQTFAPGAAPVAGYEGTNFARFVTTGQTTTTTRTNWIQPIEDVRTFAGETVTVSFWAKAATGTPKMSVEFTQNFSAGGSSTVIIDGGRVTLSTAWARYSVTVAIPSISGKTIGTGAPSLGLLLWVSGGSDFNSRIGSMGIQSNTFDIWGVQVEAGSIATPFQTATGTIQGELSACMRYYFQTNLLSDNTYSPAIAATVGVLGAYFAHPVPMRVAPTITTYDTAVASGNVTRSTYGGANQTGQASTVFQTNILGTNIYSASGNSHTFIRFGYAAAAEL
jgi:hypothetical protein